MSTFAGMEEPPDSGRRTLDFSALYDRHISFVWRNIRRLGVPEADAEDLCQEVFVVVHRRLDSFQGRAALRTWIYSILLGIVRNYRRSIKRRRINPDISAEHAAERLRAEQPALTPEHLVERTQSMQLLYRLLDQLDDDKREMLVMADLEQLRGTEIAAITGIKRDTVYARLRAARRDLSRALERLRGQQAGGAP